MAVRPLRGAAAADLPGILLSRRAGHRSGATSGSRPAQVCSTSTCGRSRSPPRLFLFLFTLPILAKWMLIGRWKPQQIRIWSLAYVRFWVVKTLVAAEPAGAVHRFAAVRALPAGAGREGRAGRGDLLHTRARSAPTCSPSATARSSARTPSSTATEPTPASSRRVRSPSGKDVLVSETTVIDIDTSMGDGTQLGHASSLHAGQAVPDGQRWHGSPAAADRGELPDGRSGSAAAPCGGLVYAIWQLLTMLLVYLPVASAVASCCPARRCPRLERADGRRRRWLQPAGRSTETPCRVLRALLRLDPRRPSSS